MKKIMLPLFLFLQIGLVLFGVYQFDGFSDLASPAPTPRPTLIPVQYNPNYTLVPIPTFKPTSAPTARNLASTYSGMTGYSNPQQYNQQRSVLTIDNCKYVLNTYSMKFHRPACEYAHQMRPENALYSNDSRSEIISAGYKPCNWCRP